MWPMLYSWVNYSLNITKFTETVLDKMAILYFVFLRRKGQEATEDGMIRNLATCTRHQIQFGDKMDGACSMQGRDEKWHTKFWS